MSFCNGYRVYWRRTISHIDHGQTTPTAAILAVQATKGLAEIKSYKEIAVGGPVRDENKTVTIIASHIQYETATRHYAHIDCPGHADYITDMITGPAQTSREGISRRDLYTVILTG